MPGATPIFGIRYPFQGEPVTVADFQNTANDIDAALDLADAAAVAATQRPEVITTWTVAGPAATASGAVTPIPFLGVVRDNAGWWSGGAPTLLTVPAGVYDIHVYGKSVTWTGVGTVGEATAVQVAGVTVLRRTLFQSFTTGMNPVIAGAFYVAAPSAVRVVWTWWGSGGTQEARPQAVRMRQIKAI